MNTLLFSLSYLDGLDGIQYAIDGNKVSESTRVERHIKWLDYYEKILNLLEVDKIVLVDNASDHSNIFNLSPKTLTNATIDFSCSWHNNDFVREYLDIHRFDDHLPRKSCLEYPYIWRGTDYVKQIIKKYNPDKIIMTDTDCFIMNSEMCEFIKNMDSGWNVFWCKRYGFPEAALSVLCKDSFHLLDEFFKDGWETKNNVAAELVFPYTGVIKEAIGDRYGEYTNEIPKDADFACQIPVEMKVEFKS
jgi:hypothetical protein